MGADVSADDGDVAGMDHPAVIVPIRPGPMIVVGRAARKRQTDDLDDLIDELFPEIEGGPGWFDVALLAGGIGLLVAGLVASKTALAVIGVGLLLLGVILPLRMLWRRLDEQRRRSRYRREKSQGLVLSVESAEVSRLAAVYDDLLTVASTTQPKGSAPSPAVTAAHEAVVEVASLLEGRAPVSERERAYIDRRTESIEAVLAMLTTAQAPESTVADWTVEQADARVDAREELDHLASDGSLARLEALRLHAGEGLSDPG